MEVPSSLEVPECGRVWGAVVLQRGHCPRGTRQRRWRQRHQQQRQQQQQQQRQRRWEAGTAVQLVQSSWSFFWKHPAMPSCS